MSGGTKRKWLRWLLTSLVAGGITLFAAFSALVVSPFEGRFGDIASAVPLDTDLYIAKRGLGADFPEFPTPVFYSRLKQTQGWTAFLRSDLRGEVEEEYGVEAMLATLADSSVSLPFDLMDDLAGRELVVALRFRPGGFHASRWTVLARASWRIRVGLGLLERDWLREIFAPDLAVEVTSEPMKRPILRIQGVLGGDDLFLMRDRDLVVAARTLEDVESVRRVIGSSRGRESVGQSARYHDEVVRRRPGPRDLEWTLDPRALAESTGIGANWPDPVGAFSSRLLSNFFRMSNAEAMAGLARFGEGIRIEGALELDRGSLDRAARKLHSLEPDDLSGGADRYADLAPATTYALFGGRVPVHYLMTAFEGSLTDEVRADIDDLLQRTGRYESLMDLLLTLEKAFEPRIAILLREHDKTDPDYKPGLDLPDDWRLHKNEEGYFSPFSPPNDGGSDPLWAVCLWMRHRDVVESVIDDLTKEGYRALGFEIQPFDYELMGTILHEQWTPLVPGTGEVAWGFFTGRGGSDLFVVSNHARFIEEIGRARGGRTPSVQDLPAYRAARSRATQSSSMFVWLNGLRLADYMEQQADEWVREILEGRFDDVAVQARADTRLELLGSRFAGARTTSDLTRPQRDELERLVEDRMRALHTELWTRDSVSVGRGVRDRIRWLHLLPSIFVNLHLERDAINFEIEARVGF